MADLFLLIRGRSDDVRIRTALVLSIVIHAAALVVWMPPYPGQPLWPGPNPAVADGLQVSLAAPAATTSLETVDLPAVLGEHRASAPARTAPAAPPAARRAVAEGMRTKAPGSRETTPILSAPGPEAPANASVEGPQWWRLTAAALAQAHAAPSAGGDLSSSIAARRRELAVAQSGGHSYTLGGVPTPESLVDDEHRHRGGLFAITRMAYDDAEFLFFGWKDDPDRPRTQAVQVRLGANGDMRIAVVRRMIALIREHEHGDFKWQSWRLGRIVELSARSEDGVGLEDFLLREFFESRQAAAPR